MSNQTASRFQEIDYSNLGFGKYFSDHVFEADNIDNVWSSGVLKQYSPMSIEPGMSTLHYGQTIFEGLKAYRDLKNGGVNIFRPEMNSRRLNRSAKRLCMPQYLEENFLDAIKQLVIRDKRFIPNERGQSLYIRPLLFGDGNFLGVHPSDSYKLLIMTSPVASYYEEGLKPLKILVSHEYARTVRGGLGAAKTAANYAASLYAAKKAKQEGYSQVLWLDGVSMEYIDEVGAMNIVFVIDNKIITPALDSGTILAGVTRDTVIQLSKDFGYEVEERRIKVSEVFDSHKKGTLQEVFGTGTAAIISPVGQLTYNDKDIVINNMEIGPVAQKFYDTILGLVHGEIEDKNNWNLHLDI
ncbi:branched-chain amino acid aminotransferase [Candidatus Kapabacteria bacterium]|nr:branched-chain amino acid aminotransferase [Candidatus Kapabacteria bacterium]